MLLPGLANHTLSHLNSPAGRLRVKKRMLFRSNTESMLFASRNSDENLGRRAAVAVDGGEFIREVLKLAEHAAENSKLLKPKKAKSLDVYWNERETLGNLPEAREGGSMVSIGRRVFLFGGLSRGLFNDVRMLRLDSSTWSTMFTVEGEQPPDARTGHIMVPYKQKFIVYGGCGSFDKTLRIRQCFSRVHIFDTERSCWQTTKPSGEQPEARRNHAGVIMGTSVVIYGGINSNGKYLDDLQILNIDTNSWLQPKVTSEGLKPGKLAYFTMTAVYPAAMRNAYNYDIFHLPEMRDEVFNGKNSGIYLFGGIDRNNKVKNTVFVLKIKRFKATSDGLLRWVQLNPAGTPPQARYAHTAAVVTKYLIIIGGRTDEMTALGGYDVTEVAALNLENNTWETVNIKGEYPGGRWSACSTCIGSSLLYFGGMRLEKYSRAKTWIMETDPYNVSMLMARDAETLIAEKLPKQIKRKQKVS
mmetsp:Transcript_3897/g.8170  ORF Transcript_3897/g.8170 Transcript_3897/m.8170 type:complete len:472 (+) Transcript_3897:822-2237(+)